MEKRCSRCKLTKHILDFHKQKSSADGHRATCKVCNIKAVKEWQDKNTNWQRKRLYGMPEGDYEKLLEEQNGLCAICSKYPKFFVVDHDHLTGVIRGILCQSCNLGLTRFHDNPKAAEIVWKYLLRGKVLDADSEEG